METFKPDQSQKTLNDFRTLIDLSSITDEDVKTAIEDWENSAPDGYKNLLDVEVTDENLTV